MPRALDHLVLASRDLEAAAQFWRRIGFTVGGRNQHPWGTENHIIQLQGAFLELIGLGAGFVPPAASDPAGPFAGFLAGFLAKGEGPAMLALRAADARADHAAFAHSGIGTGEVFDLARIGNRGDGRDVQVAFSLAFAHSRLIGDAGFFTCQQHNPENFWNTAAQIHSNTASRLNSVVMVAENPSAHAEFLSHFCGEREMLATSMGIELHTGDGRIEVLTPLAFQFRFGVTVVHPTPHLAGLRIGVRDMQTARACLAANAVPQHQHAGLLVVAPLAAPGAVIAFEADHG